MAWGRGKTVFLGVKVRYNRSPEGKKQWRLCTRNIIALVQNFLEEEYDIIIEGYLGGEDRGCWGMIFEKLPIDYKFLLLPQKDVLLQRDRERSEASQLGEKDILRHWDFYSQAEEVFFDFHMMDSSQETGEETSRTIFTILQTSSIS